VGRATLYLTLVMIGLVAVNVLLRYSLSFGSVWAQELEWHLLATIILLGMSYALQRGDNVRVDVFYANFTPRAKFVVNLVSLGRADAGDRAAVHQALAGLRAQSWAIGETSADPGGIPYRWAVKGLIPLGFGLLALQTVGALLRLVLIERQRLEAPRV
jgi:TRAP-type mannitol/chloroaromatic compound transport system permease small subunit